MACDCTILQTHVYAIRNSDETVYKIDKNAQGIRVSDGASKRAKRQIRKLNSETGSGYALEIRKTFIKLTYEIKLIERYHSKIYGKDTLPSNKTNR